ncbi:signal peptidase [Pseudarthrobacter siccitolerans]|uniref:Signal peptidase I n=1 Tax=Pseudarthrobacter siccitolerans TaxID=861266 RepID=A0ABU0PIB9_9MICC|nr:signal peptidase I [Pseudarthrobacter siccitolerans]MDQ0673703.1 signal peptidase [Pseudarthrobacter siccitolerans]
MTRGKRRSTPDDTNLGWWVRQTASWVLLLSVFALLTATIIVPKVAGATPYTVLTGSMRPGMPPGSLVVTLPVEPGQLKTGEAITYQLRSGEPGVVTHRITSVSTTFKGERLFTTQGDANPSPDDKPVKAGQIRGVVWYSLPLLGYVNGWLTGEQHIWAVGITVVGLLGYAAFMYTSALIEARRRRRPHPANTLTEAS